MQLVVAQKNGRAKNNPSLILNRGKVMLTFCKTPQIALCKNCMFPARRACLYLYLYTILIRFLHSLGFVHNLQQALGVYIQIQRYAYH